MNNDRKDIRISIPAPAAKVIVRLHELGCDGFSTDYPSVMFSVIRKLKDRK